MSDKMNTYEGMFLVPAGLGDFERAREPVDKVLARVEADVLSIRPWDERRLAYEIEDQRRGLYVLVYFKADPSRIAEIEHECQLDEGIMRVMILRRQRLTEDNIAADTPASLKAASEAARAEAAEARDREAADARDREAARLAEASAEVSPDDEPATAAEAEVKADTTVEPQAEVEADTPVEPQAEVEADTPVEDKDGGDAETAQTEAT